ncbi:N4-gp56 family major capsid protein [Oxalobacteraceae bacterium GrIS 1.11]
MANTTYGDISPRTAAYAEKELLKRALPFLVIEKFGQAKALPEGSSKTIVFRRYSALDPSPTALTEGVTPGSQTMTSTDVPCLLTQYGSMITISDIVMDTHEDNVLNEAIDLLGEQAAQMIERMRYGILRAGTNVVYANGATRNAVNTAITLAGQRKIVKALKRQNAEQISKVVKSTPAFGTEAVAKAYICLIHPDMESDVRNMLGADGKSCFVPVEKYGSLSPYENEIGKVEDVRYLSSTIFTPFVDAGGAKGLMTSTSGTSADVYPALYIASNAYAIVALKGMFALTPMVVNPKPSDSDPLAQRGRVAWKAMQGAVILNDQWMVRGEFAVTA